MRRAKQRFRVTKNGRGMMLYRMNYGEYKIFKGYSFTAEFGRDVDSFTGTNPKRKYFSKVTPRNDVQELILNLNYNFNLPWESRNYLNYYLTN